ncbi:MAG: hypothetical protein ACTTIC_06605 [Helicobacteraceae bacterium]
MKKIYLSGLGIILAGLAIGGVLYKNSIAKEHLEERVKSAGFTYSGVSCSGVLKTDCEISDIAQTQVFGVVKAKKFVLKDVAQALDLAALGDDFKDLRLDLSLTGIDVLDPLRALLSLNPNIDKAQMDNLLEYVSNSFDVHLAAAFNANKSKVNALDLESLAFENALFKFDMAIQTSTPDEPKLTDAKFVFAAKDANLSNMMAYEAYKIEGAGQTFDEFKSQRNAEIIKNLQESPLEVLHEYAKIYKPEHQNFELTITAKSDAKDLPKLELMVLQMLENPALVSEYQKHYKMEIKSY